MNFMKKYFPLIASLSLFLVLTSPLSAQTSAPATFNADGITLTCPAGWQMDDKGTLGTTYGHLLQ